MFTTKTGERRQKMYFRIVFPVLCLAGYEALNLECEEEPCPAPTCEQCSVGFFKPEPGNSPCGPCPENTTTAGNGTTSQEQCNIGMLKDTHVLS